MVFILQWQRRSGVAGADHGMVPNGTGINRLPVRPVQVYEHEQEQKDFIRPSNKNKNTTTNLNNYFFTTLIEEPNKRTTLLFRTLRIWR